MTKSPHTGQGSVGQPCAASVSYQDRQRRCQREGKHPDIDGIRWWCGLHTPNRKKKGNAEEVEVVVTTATASVKPRAEGNDKRLRAVSRAQPASSSSGIDMAETLMSATRAQVADSVALDALRLAQEAFSEIANTNTVGWGSETPVENYKIIMSHMSDRARETGELVSEALRKLSS